MKLKEKYQNLLRKVEESFLKALEQTEDTHEDYSEPALIPDDEFQINIGYGHYLTAIIAFGPYLRLIDENGMQYDLSVLENPEELFSIADHLIEKYSK